MSKKIAVIGAGQSAAEIFLDLHGRPNNLQVDLIMRGRAMHPSDDSPSVNEIFNVEFTDYMYSRSPVQREQLLAEFRHTNYAAPDIDQIQQIFKILYSQKVMGWSRHRVLPHHKTQSVSDTSDGIQLTLLDLDTQKTHRERYDAVILATGYTRIQHKKLLAPVAAYLSDFTVDRHYRLLSDPQFKPAIFLQGACEDTHGISDTLLSVMAVRTREIGDALANVMHKKREVIQKYPVTA
ncbi:MAG: lysine N(6)-hydroxylase/L-ornithine N(5)-oxygenase family protein [Cellvibrionaceae bacterium]|nr:lysine N(6)-hydroxylase/L-ornithine N(5)-oxygenase family protein [Cellvibrionaceae bacterium]